MDNSGAFSAEVNFYNRGIILPGQCSASGWVSVEVVVGVAEMRKGETETEQRVRDTGGGGRQTESETERK